MPSKYKLSFHISSFLYIHLFSAIREKKSLKAQNLKKIKLLINYIVPGDFICS